MKNTKFIIYANVGLALIVTFFLSGCGSDDNVSPQETTKKQLRSGQWKLQSLKVDGVETNLYSGMTLSFGEGTYETSNGSPVWPASGTWTFASTDPKIIERDGAISIVIDQLSPERLVLSFQWEKTTYSGGKQASIRGMHVFDFTK